MKKFFWSDKTGHGGSGTVTLDGIKNADDEFNWDGDPLSEWAESAEQGNEWENSTDKYICTES